MNLDSLFPYRSTVYWQAPTPHRTSGFQEWAFPLGPSRIDVPRDARSITLLFESGYRVEVPDELSVVGVILGKGCITCYLADGTLRGYADLGTNRSVDAVNVKANNYTYSEFATDPSAWKDDNMYLTTAVQTIGGYRGLISIRESNVVVWESRVYKTSERALKAAHRHLDTSLARLVTGA